ncbi:MAG: PleD family two-component system response regulator [Candidatus Moraniibacteriota bacterium]|jgi:PleD family two-component response regulator
MTLQNKRNDLLNTEDAYDDNALDLFDKYSVTIDEDNPVEINADLSIENELEEQKEPLVQEEVIVKSEESINSTKSEINEKNDDTESINNISVSETNEDEAPIHAIAPVRDNYNSVSKQLDTHNVIVTQQEESVYEASASTNGVKTEKEKTIKRSYTGDVEKFLDNNIHVDPSKKTILIVDDDIDTLEMYADVFTNANYNVLRAADGLEAIHVLSNNIPHIIFTGIVMPRMDGFEMMQALKQDKRTEGIPVIINSHLGRDTDKKQAQELGAKDFIIRGFTQPKEVLERVGALLLHSEYVIHFDSQDEDIVRLANDLGTSDFLHCPQGQRMVLKIHIDDEQNLTFSARFSCVDDKK